MAKERPQAPKASVKINYVDPKLETELEYDAKFPEYKHFWKSESNPLGDAEWAKDAKGEPVSNKMLRLARIPMDAWTSKKRQQADSTLGLMKSIRRNEDGTEFSSETLVKYANPKKLTTEE